MRQIDTNELFSKIALKHGIPKYQVELVYKTMFEMVYDSMNNQELENILLHRFGKFVIPKAKLKDKRPDLYDKVYGNNEGMEKSSL